MRLDRQRHVDRLPTVPRAELIDEFPLRLEFDAYS